MDFQYSFTHPWGAPFRHLECCVSTMDEARRWASSGAPHGAVVLADFQTGGRGRVAGRRWLASAGENLLWSIILRYADFSAIPALLSLRTGLAVESAIQSLSPSFVGKTAIKWPNDIMLNGKKAAGILVESDGKTVFIGVGINVLQQHFDAFPNATSIVNELDTLPGQAEGLRFLLLERILTALQKELESSEAALSWNRRFNERLFMKNTAVVFLSGPADSAKPVHGVLLGVGADGALCIQPNGSAAPQLFVTGELQYG